MNWDAIGAVGEIAGAVAVLISLIYLAVQIRNGRRSDQNIAVSQAVSQTTNWVGQIVLHGELNELYMRGSEDFNSLTREEKNRFAWLIMQFLRSIEGIWRLYQSGTIDPDYWASYESTVRRILGSAGATRCFERNRDLLSFNFVSAVDGMVSSGGPSQRGAPLTGKHRSVPLATADPPLQGPADRTT